MADERAIAAVLSEGERDAIADACDAGYDFGEAWVRMLRNGLEDMLLPVVERILADRLAAIPGDDTARALAWEDGVRQAIKWLRSDYPYGDGPDWREHGCEWIAALLASHTAARAADGVEAGL